MTKKARIAVVGTGWWATAAHIPSLLENDSAELVALCDQNEAKLTLTGQAYGLDRLYTNVGDMLDKEALDGAIVATNHTSHYTVARDCLQGGLYTLIEKPMTLFASEARELIELARSHNVEVSMGYNHVYKPYTVRAREIVQSGALGECPVHQWHFQPAHLRPVKWHVRPRRRPKKSIAPAWSTAIPFVPAVVTAICRSRIWPGCCFSSPGYVSVKSMP